MTADMTQDWNPETYARFRGLRLRPALDLLAQVGTLPAGGVVDLGCGDGAVGPVLAARFGAVTGVDTSPAMLARAGETGAYAALVLADIAEWQPDGLCALIFSNAALHWLGDHARLLPRLAGFLEPGGMLAVQMPGQFNAPSHALLRQIAGNMFPDRFDFTSYDVPVHALETYHAMLAGLGEVAVWETSYLQRQPAVADGHPVRAFTESTAMRPFVERLTKAEAAGFVTAYDAALHEAYPVLEDGSALFPFRRVFLTLRV
ncbi:MAG: methyltransferase domain-containing protein [Paracoccaceae bacterium]